jgi:hypothetical protein
VYISGGISGKPNGNKEAFAEMEDRLHAMGFDVENPRRTSWPAYLRLDDPQEFKEGWAICMRHAIRQQAICDAVVFLPDWQESKGATIEYQMAQVFGQPCFSADLQLITPSAHTPAKLLRTP